MSLCSFPDSSLSFQNITVESGHMTVIMLQTDVNSHHTSYT